MKKIGWLGMVIAAGALFAGCGEAKKVDASVVSDLQSAYNGEMNAAAKYELYAAKAAENGYESVAALFRATHKAESLHAARHARVLKSLGVEPKAEVKLPEYVDVEASLRDGIKGETYEMTTMYPEFIANAKAKGAPAEVIETLTFALEAEKEHAKFYTEAVNAMEEWRPAGKTFYVCSVCGYTTDKPLAACILCAAPGDKFEVFK
ncbi:MAG: rubrerythrin family protein [Victivallaceae bacterium]|nr:rubrerythrin family protein [Victivallaceae bacterium]